MSKVPPNIKKINSINHHIYFCDTQNRNQNPLNSLKGGKSNVNIRASRE